jgi:hypothetical protein
MPEPREAHPDRLDAGRPIPSSTRGDHSPADRVVADREVPLPGMAAADDPALVPLHQWLDGDGTEGDARRQDARHVELWKQIGVETDARRRMTTPAHVAANIMNALPEVRTATHAPAATSSLDGYSLPVVVGIGAAMLAVGFLVGRLF